MSRKGAEPPDDDERRLDEDLEDLERRLKEIEGEEEFQRTEQKILREIAEEVREEFDLSPPPPIDPARLEAIPELKSLLEGHQVMKAIDRNIRLVEGREALAKRARQLELLKLANGAKRCRHFKLDGTGCGSPALRGQDYCHYHHQLHADSVDFKLFMEDWDSLHVNYERLARDIVRGVIPESKARLLIQIFQAVAKHVLKNREMDGRKAVETVPGDPSEVPGD